MQLESSNEKRQREGDAFHVSLFKEESRILGSFYELSERSRVRVGAQQDAGMIPSESRLHRLHPSCDES